jgi:hypothetical protein
VKRLSRLVGWAGIDDELRLEFQIELAKCALARGRPRRRSDGSALR